MTGDRVDRLTFAWARRLANGGSGLGLVHSSLPENEWAGWSNELVNRVSVPPGDPAPSTCYLLVRDRAVLVHRTPARDQLHRDSTRTLALIGPPHVLTLGRAIALRPDTPPAQGDDPCGSYPDEWAAASDDDDSLAAVARTCREQAVALVAGLLAAPHPGAGVAIRARGADPRALLWVASACLSDPDWTFSTRESTIAATGLPRLVFTPVPPSRSSFGSERLWLDLGQPPGVGRSDVRRAGRLVDQQLGRVVAVGRVVRNVPGPASASGGSAVRNGPGPASASGGSVDQDVRSEPEPRTVPAGLLAMCRQSGYTLRLSILILWSIMFIVLLALAGRVGP